jgi:hypothetical protein
MQTPPGVKVFAILSIPGSGLACSRGSAGRGRGGHRRRTLPLFGLLHGDFAAIFGLIIPGLIFYYLTRPEVRATFRR